MVAPLLLLTHLRISCSCFLVQRLASMLLLYHIKTKWMPMRKQKHLLCLRMQIAELRRHSTELVRLAAGGFARLMLPTRPTSALSTTAATVAATPRPTAFPSRSASVSNIIRNRLVSDPPFFVGSDATITSTIYFIRRFAALFLYSDSFSKVRQIIVCNQK